MASSSSKRLWEHLQEQQKPFRLDVYLSERRCMMNKNQEKPRAYNSNKSKNLQVKKILKLITRRFTDSSHSQQLPSCNKAQKDELSTPMPFQTPLQSGETRFLKLRSSIAVPVASESSVKDSPCCNNGSSQAQKNTRSNEQRAAVDREHRWRCKADNEQLSPVSVLKGVSSSRKEQEEYASTLNTNSGEREEEEESIASAVLWESLKKSLIAKQSHARIMELQESIGPGFSVCLKNKRVLQQSRQLLFDYIREAIEIHPRETKRKKHAQEMMCPQELGKIISERICSWGNENIVKQMHFDVSSVLEHWDYAEEFKRKLGKQIGDSIMDELVKEVIGLFFPVILRFE